MYFDSHAHFDLLKGGDPAELIARALAAGVNRILAVGSSAKGNDAALSVAERFPETVSVAMGYDRDQAALFARSPELLPGFVDDLMVQLKLLVEQGKPIVALGEMGLDYHYSADTRALQLQLFKEQLRMARELCLPVIVHSREAERDTLNCLRDHVEAWNGEKEKLGVLHCFTGRQEFADELITLGFYISFSGIITFPKAEDIRLVAQSLPAERLLVETDTPFLAPVPYRGKSNEPAYVEYVVEKIAEIKGVSAEEMAKCTTTNACQLFDVSGNAA